ncbi:hypothetical protein KIW84_023648 [Lathyrus oleraceus]|uniref:Uncharacterized protein n=1 Tax=Pisum sativum TaxID=3888 RepID=A0A9D5BC18_PEA|nr:hypothetical protein KIW84_023648 [Pisum sativum]
MKSFNGENITPTGSRNFGCLVSGKNDSDEDQTQFGSLLAEMRKSCENSVRQAENISDEEDQNDACLQQESSDIEPSGSLVDSVMDTDNRNSLILRDCFRSTVNKISVPEAADHTEYHDTNIDSPIENGSSEGSDDRSKNSTLENMPSPRLYPDDVAEILGIQF